MENPEGVVGISQVLKKPRGILKAELDAELLRRIKPRQRLLIRHLPEK
jgi:hypothetical protein